MSSSRSTAGSTGGSGPTRAATSTRRWRDRLNDPDEPLFTMAIAADLLGLDTQTLRRLGEAVAHPHHRPSGNQRRYSRNDIELLGKAADLADEGHNASAIRRIIDLEQRVEDLTAGSP